MIEFILMGGPFMLIQLVIAGSVAWLSIAKFYVTFRKKEIDKEYYNNGVNAIIFWGGMGLLLGIFGHFMGVYQAMNAIRMANDISPAIVAGGYAMSLSTVLFGLGIFLFSAIIWFYLRSWSNRHHHPAYTQ